MTNRDVVYIGIIEVIEEIENADFLVSATAVCGEGGKWTGVVRKGDFEVGDLCNVFLQDALIPDDLKNSLPFLESSKWRVRMAKFRGAPSECVITKPFITGVVGVGISDELGVTKYEKPVPAQLAGVMKGAFPSFIPKTDEVNFQSAPKLVDAVRGKLVYITMKYDGSSGTVYKYRDEFGVCSRNLELVRNEKNSFWRLVEEWGLEETLPEGFAVQFELYGEGVQKNPLKAKGVNGAIFNLFNIQHQKFESYDELKRVCVDVLDVPMVSVLAENHRMPQVITGDYLRKLAEVRYPLGGWAEGIVIRPMEEEVLVREGRVSFKVINLLYKEK